jgi:LPS-assembly protein
MPPFMRRSSALWMMLSVLGAVRGVAWADEPPCPTQVSPQPATAPAAATTATSPAHGPPRRANPHQKPKPVSATDLKGPGKIDITSDQQATYSADGTATVKGNVEVRQGDRVINAHDIQYNPKTAAVRAEGQIDYTDPAIHVAGSGGGSYSASDGADFKAAQFQLRQRAARGAATDISASPAGVVTLKGVTFTTCPLHNDAWLMKADSIVLDTNTQVGTAHDAKIDFMNVPLLYLPWLSFPLDNERKSGFLFPSIGNTSSSGVQLSLPYYFNLAPNYDFTFEPTEYSKRGPDLGGDFRFLTEGQHGDLQWNYLPDDSVYGGSRSRVQLNDVAELGKDWRLTLDAQNVSDPLYFEDFSQSPQGTSTAFLNRSAVLSYRDEHWNINGAAQQYQTIDDTLPVDDRPYARLPWVTAASRYSYDDFIHYGFDSEIVDFQHAAGAVGPNGWREDLMPQGYLDFSGAGYFLRPALAWRFTAYQLDDLLPGEVHSPTRSVPLASLDSGLVFEKSTGSRGQRTITLEPRVMYLYVPYRNQDELPVFDTALPDLSFLQLFRTNRYVGPDRVSDANQVSLGVTSRLLDAADGRQFLAATIGQTYYFQTPRVTLPDETPATGSRSDFVAQLSVTAFQNWTAEAGVQWDPQNQRSERTLVGLQYKPAPDAVINVAYRYERFVQEPEYVQGIVPIQCVPVGSVPPPLAPGQTAPPMLPTCDSQGYDQVDVSGAWPIRRNWALYLRDVYSIHDSKELERFAGFEYRSCCWRLRLGARRYVSSFSGSQDTGIWLQLELTGLAGVGSASDTSLTEEIRGYTPPDANTQRLGAQ